AADWSSGKQMRSPADIIVNNGDGQPPSEMHWRALKGSNLRQVLDSWTRNTGVQFIWSADQDFAVQRSLSFQGTFDSAVKSLLAEYDGQSSRPKGRIYQQPGTGKPVLVIELETSPTNHFSE
ncbi:MAG TPA: TcpQ domain-containing protein, partial [Micavibrio sp.]